MSQNLVNGDEVVFHDGYLAKAMRASMAIPGVFTPVYKDSLVLIDGGMINNYPVDVARSMGADIIIGVDVQSDLMEAKNLALAVRTSEENFGVIDSKVYVIPLYMIGEYERILRAAEEA